MHCDPDVFLRLQWILPRQTLGYTRCPATAAQSFDRLHSRITQLGQLKRNLEILCLSHMMYLNAII